MLPNERPRVLLDGHVIVNGDLPAALRIFKKKSANVLWESRRHAAFTKPGDRRRIKHAAYLKRIKRQIKRARAKCENGADPLARFEFK